MAKVDLKAKQKRQKILAGVLGAVLLAVLAFQLPRTLKMLHGSSASASPPPATTATATPTGAPVSTGGSSSGSSDGVSDPRISLAPRSGQLLAFSRFRSKDPFAQQLGTSCTDTCGTATATGTGTTGASGATRRGGPTT